jgi:hypothetical protein
MNTRSRCGRTKPYVRVVIGGSPLATPKYLRAFAVAIARAAANRIALTTFARANVPALHSLDAAAATLGFDLKEVVN